VKPRPVEELDPSELLRSAAARIVTVRLAELRGFAEEAMRPEESRTQHNMRIAAKRFRYLLEIFEACLGEAAKPARDAAKRVQGVLGDLHDCDLMLPKVDGIPSAAALLRERRARLHGEFVALWQAEAAKGTWASLERLL